MEKHHIQNLRPITLKRNDELIARHRNFSLSFTKNDPLKIMELLDENVMLSTSNEENVQQVIHGKAKVLSHLVSSEMTTLSQHILSVGDFSVKRDKKSSHLFKAMTTARYTTLSFPFKCRFDESIKWSNSGKICQIKWVPVKSTSNIFKRVLKQKCLLKQLQIFPIDSSTNTIKEKSHSRHIMITKVKISDLTKLGGDRNLRYHPYIIVSTSSRKNIWTSSIQRNETSPIWNVEIGVELFPELTVLEFHLFNWRLLKSKKLGFVIVDVADLYQNRGDEFSFVNSLSDTANSPIIEITIRKEWYYNVKTKKIDDGIKPQERQDSYGHDEDCTEIEVLEPHSDKFRSHFLFYKSSIFLIIMCLIVGIGGMASFLK